MRVHHLVLLLVGLVCMPFSASAHTLWINLYESHDHLPAHAVSSIGWGHALPMDDTLNSLHLQAYELVDPDMNVTALPMPEKITAKPMETKSGVRVDKGDVGVRKMVLPEEAAKGTYQVCVVSADNYYSKYINTKGRPKWALKPMDQVENAKKLISGMRYKAYAKSFFTVGEWKKPKPMGYDLEILPETDLGNVRVGDKVEFRVLFMGKPLSTSPEKSIEYITATSNTFGGPDKFTLAAILFNGKGSFRMPTAGQWLINVYARQEVGPDSPLKDYVGKCTTALYSSSLSFNVKP
jgi:uncharacterized GH25 family protein